MGVRLRAHAKTHKSADIARLQIERGGACGICCQKVSEAEAMARAGIRDILIANEVTDPAKMDRLARLARDARIIVCVDDATAVATLSAAAVRLAPRSRCWSRSIAARAAAASRPGGGRGAWPVHRAGARPRFSGIQAYHGRAQHFPTEAERRAAIAGRRDTPARPSSSSRFRSRMRHRRRRGTGSHPMEASSGVYNELQCGSYIFMDADYRRVRGEDGGVIAGFEHALFVLTAIMSRPVAGRAVCRRRPQGACRRQRPAGGVRPAGPDLHRRVGRALAPSTIRRAPRLNERLRLVPGHCDPTCNLHDWYVGVRNGRVETLWPVTARGKLY